MPVGASARTSALRTCGLASFAVLALLLAACEPETPEVVEHVRAIKTITVAERASGQARRFPGVVAAVDTAVLSFEVAGNTRTVAVEVGDRVTQGQTLATLDETPFQLNVDAAAAEVDRAKAELAEKTTEFERQKALHEKQWIAKAAYDQALAARDSAASQVSYATSKLNLARRELDKTVLSAPFDGVIASKDVDPFQEVARGEPVFEIYIEGAKQVVLSIPETAIGDIHLGLPAQVSFPSERVPAAAGRVSEIGTVATEANAFPVKVALDDPPPELLPGMTAEAALILGDDRDAAYLVPISAIVPGPAPEKGYVFVYDAASTTVRRTEIVAGGVRDDQMLVSDGVAAGDIVAVAGASFLRDGQKVKLLSP
jgi:RND family efflux transporter MFP subunit